MPALTIKNIPDDVYNALKDRSKQQHRSINSEVIMFLKRSLLPKRISSEERLSTIRAIRSQVKSGAITAEDINQAINKGRP